MAPGCFLSISLAVLSLCSQRGLLRQTQHTLEGSYVPSGPGTSWCGLGGAGGGSGEEEGLGLPMQESGEQNGTAQSPGKDRNPMSH